MWEAIETPRPSAWRVIFKGLTLLEHLLKNGSERCVDDARSHSHLLRNLDRFNYYEGTVDRGVGVREKSKQVVEILQDDERIREERQKARHLREKFSGRGASATGGGGGERRLWRFPADCACVVRYAFRCLRRCPGRCGSTVFRCLRARSNDTDAADGYDEQCFWKHEYVH